MRKTDADTIMMVAGEASGELYGAKLAEALLQARPSLSIFGMGGKRMGEAGVEILYDVKESAVLGLLEVTDRLLVIRSFFKGLLRAAAEKQPRAAILIDYPDFNLRLAAQLHRRKIPVIYYVSPQLWAWRKGRVKKIEKYVSKMLVILPFEEPYYRRAGVRAEFIGHPLVDMVQSGQNKDAFLQSRGLKRDIPLIGLLPGSRRKEVQMILPAMVRALSLLKTKLNYQAVIARAETVPEEEISRILQKEGSVYPIIGDSTYTIMKHADVLIVASGSATLEAALFGTPMVVVYKTFYPTYWIGMLMISVEHYCLANLVMGERVVPELIQKDMTPENIAGQLERILCHPEVQADIRLRLSKIRDLLGQEKVSERAAKAVLSLIDKQNT